MFVLVADGLQLDEQLLAHLPGDQQLLVGRDDQDLHRALTAGYLACLAGFQRFIRSNIQSFLTCTSWLSGALIWSAPSGSLFIQNSMVVRGGFLPFLRKRSSLQISFTPT